MSAFEEAQSLFHEGQKQASLNNKQTAEEIFGQIIKNGEMSVNSKAICDAKDWKKLLALTYNDRGHVRYLQVDFTEAVDDYSKALMYDDTLTVAYYNRGLIHYRLGRFKLAAEDQRKALSLEPDFQSAQQCLEQCIKEFLKQQTAS